MTTQHHPAMTATQANTRNWTQVEYTWDDILAWLPTPTDHKENRGYVFGEFTTTLRRYSDFRARDVITLDFDRHAAEVPGAIRALGVRAAAHTTWSHAPDDPRWRGIFPLDRMVSAAEYEIAAESLAQKLVPSAVDPASFSAVQFMWRPSAQQLDWYEFLSVDGPVLSAQELIDSHDDTQTPWRKRPLGRIQKRDPFTIKGWVGAFNRRYQDLNELIAKYDIPYEEVSPDRYKYTLSHSVAGMGPIPERPGLWYSHHSTDPAGGKAQSAFDLVRIHRHGELDAEADPATPINRLPSYVRMIADVEADEDVKSEFFTSEFDPVLEDEMTERTWRTKLTLDKHGRVQNTITNLELILHHDDAFSGIAYNEMLDDVVSKCAFPWSRGVRSSDAVSQFDRSACITHLERAYGLRVTMDRLTNLINTLALSRPFHPVRDYLSTLVWDGIPRMEYCLPGVPDSPHARMAARVTLLGAVARVLDPGCQHDTALILYGPEGIGKTRWLRAMSLGYIAQLGDIGEKDTLITAHRTWFAVADEAESMRRAEFSALKSFMTRTTDNFRRPYERSDSQWARQFVIVGTTNDQQFLRDEEGNRRFLIVHCQRPSPHIFDKGFIDQVWAEAVARYRDGEQTFLSLDEELAARENRAGFTLSDDLVGQIEAYMNMKVPDNWDMMSSPARRQWFQTGRHGEDVFVPAGDRTPQQISAPAVARKILGVLGAVPEAVLRRIYAALGNSRWLVPAGNAHDGPYGVQLVYREELI